MPIESAVAITALSLLRAPMRGDTMIMIPRGHMAFKSRMKLKCIMSLSKRIGK